MGGSVKYYTNFCSFATLLNHSLVWHIIHQVLTCPVKRTLRQPILHALLYGGVVHPEKFAVWTRLFRWLVQSPIGNSLVCSQAIGRRQRQSDFIASRICFSLFSLTNAKRFPGAEPLNGVGHLWVGQKSLQLFRSSAWDLAPFTQKLCQQLGAFHPTG